MSGDSWDPRYDAILYREHPVSQEHASMPLRERAAQFAAFKALTGFEEEIGERGRYTETAAEQDESRKEQLGLCLQRLLLSPGTEAVFVWFEPDARKAGGRYRRTRGALQKTDELGRTLVLYSGERIPLEALCDIET